MPSKSDSSLSIAPKPSVVWRLMVEAPTLEVRMMIVLRKSILRPSESVIMPSSRIWSNRFITSGWAFSISSNSTTE